MKQNERVEFLLEHNRRQSAQFCSIDAFQERMFYAAQHPTEMAALKCMDGRLNLSVMTETPLGIFQPFRNLGGQFDLGWPYFSKLMVNWATYAIQRAKRAVVIITYHWSKGDPHRGCRGFNYDVSAARSYVMSLKAQFERVFGKRHLALYPMVVGIETDTDGLIIHANHREETWNLAEETETSAINLEQRIRRLFPDMHEEICCDILPWIIGNMKHVKQVQQTQRPIEKLEHQEWCLAFGRGFDWLHLPNVAFIVGPYSLNLEQPIATAAQLIHENLQSGRISPEEGVVLLVNGTYRVESGPEYGVAKEKAIAMHSFAMDVIRRCRPEILPALKSLIGVTSMNNRLFHPVELI